MRLSFRGCAVALAGMAALVASGCATTQGPKPLPEEAWRGTHIYFSNRNDLPLLHRAIEEVFAPKGLNTLILEVDLQYQYTCQPKVSSGNAMTKEDARALAALCRKHGIRLIPQFQCLGHQGHRPNALLRTYPEIMAPLKPDYSDPAHYHCSWNPLHPKTNQIIFPMIDELIEAFQPEYFHVGMDEVFLFPDKTTPYYNGESTAEMFAKAVNDLHAHVVGKHGLTMLIWGDRLLNQANMPYHDYESSANGTHSAIDMIPKDIIVCDWHYLRREDYPSVRYLQEKGFRVLPTSWKSPGAALALLEYSQKNAIEDRMMGHLCSAWCGMATYCKTICGEDPKISNRNPLNAAKTFHTIADVWRK